MAFTFKKTLEQVAVRGLCHFVDAVILIVINDVIDW